LAAGDIVQLRSWIQTAKSDFRDVISPAEYPQYSQQFATIRRLPPEARDSIVAADWGQYREWLERAS